MLGGPPDRPSRRGARVALLLVCLAVPAAPVAAEEAAVRVTFLHEDLDPVWNVAGHPVVGVVLPPRPGGGDDLSIWAGPLDRAAGARTFCVDLVSRDGQYSGQAEVRVEAAGALPGPVPLIDASAHSDRLRELDPATLALHVAAADCLTAAAGEADLVVAGWGGAGGAVPPAEIDILVNARAQEAAITLATEAGASVGSATCAKVDSPRRTGYDFRCRVALELPADVERVQGVLRRRSDGIRLPPADFRIRFR